MSSSMSPLLVMTCLRSLGNNNDHPSMMESADWIISAESSLAAILGEMDIANAAHLTALIKYAKEENDVPSAANSRQSKSSRVLGMGIFWELISFVIRKNWAKTFSRTDFFLILSFLTWEVHSCVDIDDGKVHCPKRSCVVRIDNIQHPPRPSPGLHQHRIFGIVVICEFPAEHLEVNSELHCSSYLLVRLGLVVMPE